MSRRKDLTESFWEKVDKNGQTPTHMPEIGHCWRWKASKNKGGYGWILVRPRPQLAHRVSWYLHHGEWPKLCVLHRCDNPECTRPDHLFLGTRVDNAQDMVDKRRVAKGEESARVELTETAVRAIIRRKAMGEMHKDIAPDYGISKMQVSRVGRTQWLHLSLTNPGAPAHQGR